MKTITIIGTLLFALPFALISRETAVQPAAPKANVQIELDQDIHLADTPGQAVVKIRVEAPPRLSSFRQPINLSIVLDRSSSMQGERIEQARLAAIEAVRRLGPNDILSLVTYDSEIETIIPAQQMQDLEIIEAKIRGITPRGMTALYGGVNQGASEIRKHLDREYVHRVLLLSDGQANVGPSSPAELERLGRALGRENIAVTTIGVGLGYNEDLMTVLAGASDGNTHFVEAARDLPRILSEEIGDALNVFARRAVIRIEFDDSIRPLSILGRDGEIRGRTVEIPLHQLYSGQERFALIEVELPERGAGAKATIGQAEVVYEDIASRRSVTARAPEAGIRFSNDEDEVHASANTAVQAQILEIRAAEARARAIAFADEGKREEAATELRKVSSLYRYSAARLNEPAFDDLATEFAGEAEAVEDQGIGNSRRKAYRASNHQVTNQQNTK